MRSSAFWLFLLVSLCTGACSFLIDFDELQSGSKLRPPSATDGGKDGTATDGGSDAADADPG